MLANKIFEIKKFLTIWKTGCNYEIVVTIKNKSYLITK